MLNGKLTLIQVIVVASLAFSCGKKVISTKQKVSSQLKVMTYNIHHANPPQKPGVIDIDAIAKVINSEQPDIVGLQEVDQFTNRSGKIDQAKVLAEKTGLYYQFFKAIDYDGGNYGITILSRYPIRKATKIDLPQVEPGEARVLSFVEINLPSRKELIFANTHLDATRNDGNRVAQMQKILDVLKSNKIPTIILGDLNCEAKAKPIHMLDEQFVRSCVNSCGFTIPQINPNKTIDYVALKNADWKILSHRVLAEQYASDHLPIVVTYQID